MATYKLMQDIEAEDHILGPLSLRQFIFALVASFLYYISFLVYSKGAGFLLIALMPPALFFTFFAFPFGKDQPTEVWALAKLRFMFKPRQRVWDQSGVKELVTVNAPKKIEVVLTNGLSQNEVKSRLSALANTLDSRGWATKNVDINAYTNPMQYADPTSDRLVSAASAPQPVPDYSVNARDDILDETSNPVARQFTNMITQSEQTHRQQLINRMNGIEPAATASSVPTGQPVDYWFMNGAGSASANTQYVTPGQAPDERANTFLSSSDPDEEALSARLKAANSDRAPKAATAHMRTLQPLGSQPPAGMAAPFLPPANDVTQVTDPAVTDLADAAILSLANNNDLNVATLAREASKARHGNQAPDDGEVVISLH